MYAFVRVWKFHMASELILLADSGSSVSFHFVDKIILKDLSARRIFWFAFFYLSILVVWFKEFRRIIDNIILFRIFLVDAVSTRCPRKLSLNFKLVPAVCDLDESNCANLSSHLVKRALFCRYAQLQLINDSTAWWLLYRSTILTRR